MSLTPSEKLDQQVVYFKSLLEGKTFSRLDPTFNAVINWIRHFPTTLDAGDAAVIRQLVCSCFSLSEMEFFDAVRGTIAIATSDRDFSKIERDLDGLVPRSGWLRSYIEFTQNLESPYAYHLYCALVGVGAVVNRKVYIDMGGQFKVFPPMGVMLLGPSGVKKTTAGDVIAGLLQEAELVKVYQEKITPEGLVEAMKGEANAVGLVYAPEMSVFLGKQRYMEGAIPLLTRFMDCPSSWSSATIMRGNSVLKNIGISCLFCSTPDWFIRNTPADTFGGGFIARYLLIVQYGTPRIFPVPKPLPEHSRSRILEELSYMHRSFEGVMTFDPKVYRRDASGNDFGAYADWYHEFKMAPKTLEHDLLITYMERKPIHVLRLAMVLHLATHQDLQICEECFERSVKLCSYMEQFLPGLMQSMFKSSSGEEQDLVINLLRKSGGVIGHTDLIRRLQYRMRAEQIKAILSSLKEGEMIREVKDNLSRRYILVESKEKR